MAMKIYTGTGDRGKTSLFSGERVEKSHPRIEAYGDVDELNSLLGALAAALPGGDPALAADLRRIQSHLFHVGARLATADASDSAGSCGSRAKPTPPFWRQPSTVSRHRCRRSSILSCRAAAPPPVGPT